MCLIDTIIEQSLSSRCLSGLLSAPDPLDLINEVAARVPSKWYQIGIQLGISHEELTSYRDLHPTASSGQIFSFIFSTWKNSGTGDYTWATMIKALKTPFVSKRLLAHELTRKVTAIAD